MAAPKVFGGDSDRAERAAKMEQLKRERIKALETGLNSGQGMKLDVQKVESEKEAWKSFLAFGERELETLQAVEAERHAKAKVGK